MDFWQTNSNNRDDGNPGLDNGRLLPGLDGCRYSFWGNGGSFSGFHGINKSLNRNRINPSIMIAFNHGSMDHSWERSSMLRIVLLVLGNLDFFR